MPANESFMPSIRSQLGLLLQTSSSFEMLGNAISADSNGVHSCRERHKPNSCNTMFWAAARLMSRMVLHEASYDSGALTPDWSSQNQGHRPSLQCETRKTEFSTHGQPRSMPSSASIPVASATCYIWSAKSFGPYVTA